MSAGPALANAVWLASGLGHARRFSAALQDPAGAQARLLRVLLVRHARTEFGIAHDFAGIRTTTEYAHRVPLASYPDVEPYVNRIARGERDVLARGTATHLAPTSGSTGARKIIPFTADLTTAFNAAVLPWMLDLVRQRPRLLGGTAYWSISPLAEDDRTNTVDAIPVGFADDAAYLGGPRAWLVRQAMAVPSSVRLADANSFWRLTLLALLRHGDLRVISIWHPSFLELLTDAAVSAWPELIDAVRGGDCPWLPALPPEYHASWHAAPDPGRAAVLQRIGPYDWPAWWPALQVVSCWGEQAAEPGWRALVRRLPQVLVQPKGLLATECVVTIPLGGGRPLALTSHYFEFLDEAGDMRQVHQLERGRRYDVVVTNGAGLWRYRLGDVVECDGHVKATPSLRFLGRASVSDLRGEKLSEAFVASVLRDLFDRRHPSFVALRPCDAGGSAGYELLVSADLDVSSTEVAQRLEVTLCQNPHYAVARRLGQLSPVTVMVVAAEARLEEIRAFKGRLGDAKPRVLLDVDRLPRGGPQASFRWHD